MKYLSNLNLCKIIEVKNNTYVLMSGFCKHIYIPGCEIDQMSIEEILGICWIQSGKGRYKVA